MYRIRFHGRGGQGMKTASRILGSALFLSGYDVQDAPRYGAERRGAPIFAYVRASRTRIHERGVIGDPDLVVVGDEGLLQMPGAGGVTDGVDREAVLLIYGADSEAAWRDRLRLRGRVIRLPLVESGGDPAERPTIGTRCAGAAARLLGVIGRDALAMAVEDELRSLGSAIGREGKRIALDAFDRMAPNEGCVHEGEPVPVASVPRPDWIDPQPEGPRLSSPIVHATANSTASPTGLWRTLRPVLDAAKCHRCWWLCGTFCPDNCILVDEVGQPHIDYEHCKGCLVCTVQCPHRAFEVVLEHVTWEGGAL